MWTILYLVLSGYTMDDGPQSRQFFYYLIVKISSSTLNNLFTKLVNIYLFIYRYDKV